MTQSVIQPRLFHRKHAKGNSYWGLGALFPEEKRSVGYLAHPS